MRERLDKIIEADDTAWHEDSKGIDDNDMKWLIKQASLRLAMQEQFHDMQIENLTLKQQNRSYREILENIRSVKEDEDFNPYAYMMLEIVDWVEEALEGNQNARITELGREVVEKSRDTNEYKVGDRVRLKSDGRVGRITHFNPNNPEHIYLDLKIRSIPTINVNVLTHQVERV